MDADELKDKLEQTIADLKEVMEQKENLINISNN